MPEHVALYVLAGSKVDGSAVLKHVRASDFIDEINSGEGPREECGLYSLIQLVTPDDSTTFTSEADVLAYHSKLTSDTAKATIDAKWNPNCVLIADKSDAEIVYILEIDQGRVQDRLKAKARSSVEVVSYPPGPYGVEEY